MMQFSINRVLRNSINRSCRENENIKKLLMMKKKGHQIKKIYDHWRFVTELADRQNQRMIWKLCFFFCGANDRKQKLHQCLTLEVHQKVKRIAKELGDTNILSRLCEGDMVALGARYHLKCLAGFYNQYRSHERIECGNSDDDAILAGDYTFISSI